MFLCLEKKSYSSSSSFDQGWYVRVGISNSLQPIRDLEVLHVFATDVTEYLACVFTLGIGDIMAKNSGCFNVPLGTHGC